MSITLLNLQGVCGSAVTLLHMWRLFSGPVATFLSYLCCDDIFWAVPACHFVCLCCCSASVWAVPACYFVCLPNCLASVQAAPACHSSACPAVQPLYGLFLLAIRLLALLFTVQSPSGLFLPAISSACPTVWPLSRLLLRMPFVCLPCCSVISAWRVWYFYM